MFNFPKFEFIEIAMLILIGGSWLLAVMDANNRPLFADLAKIGLGAYFGAIATQVKN